MKKLITLCLSAFLFANVHAQTTIYSQNFNTGSASEWSLNTSDLGGNTTLTPNYWIINDVYAGSPPLIANTPDEPTTTPGITGAPESYYMHITSALGASLSAENCSYNASGANSYFAAMNTSIVTTGYTNVNIAFWWICKGNASAYGQLYYRTSASGAWTQVASSGTTPAAVDSYNTHNTWQQVTGIHMAAFDNQAFLEFGFRFKHASSGMDPAFGLDDITVVGTSGAVAPVASYTTTATTACQDSCITVTSTSTGTIDSVRWTTTPTTSVTIATPTANSSSICFHAAGTYTVTLTAYNSGGSNATSQVITVNPTPHPVITRTGTTLSVAGTYSSYQWVKTVTPITGATNSTYTYTVAGTYSVLVDSGGCYGFASFNTTVSIPSVNASGNTFWVNQPGNDMLSLYAGSALDKELRITIYDATGRTLIADKWTVGSGNMKQYNISFFPAGLYIIKLSNDNTSKVLRFIK